MFYEPTKRDHGLPRDPFKSLIVPRPIGWISTIGLDGVLNIAPYSHFNICSIQPHAVMFSAGSRATGDRRKDSQRNAEDVGEFVVNVVTFGMHEQMNLSSVAAPAGVSEASLANLQTLPSKLVKPPRIAGSPIQLECKHLMSIVLPCASPGAERNSMVIGQVIGVHISDEFLTNGLVDIGKLRPVARLGYMDYAVVEEFFRMDRPTNDPDAP
jgi:flavin reductase (DIM6/NTAB) family NADH-FMN oxidoreductase RutF